MKQRTEGFISVIVAIGITILTMVGAGVWIYKNATLGDLQKLSPQTFGDTSITTISSATKISDLATILPANFNSLNIYKIENSSTSINAITTLNNLATAGNLATVGTITSGTWNGGVIPILYGGTASTTIASSSVLLGAGVNGFKTVQGLGTTGQFLTSNGIYLPPSWTTSSVDLGITYHWTANHIFDSANFAIASTTNATTTNLTITGNTIANIITASGAVKSNSHSLPEILLQNNTSYTTNQAASTTVYTYIMPANTMGIDSTLEIYAFAIKNGADNVAVAYEIQFGDGTASTSLVSAAESISTLASPVFEMKSRIVNSHSTTAQRNASYKVNLRTDLTGKTTDWQGTNSTYDTGTQLYISFSAKTANAADTVGFQGITITKF